MRSFKATIVCTLFLMFCPPLLRAADGVFDPGGKAVFIARGNAVWQIDLTSPSLKKLPPLPASGNYTSGIAITTTGALLAINQNTLFQAAPPYKVWRPLFQNHSAPSLSDVAFNPRDGLAYLATEPEDVCSTVLLALDPALPKPLSVFCRRVDYLTSPVFDPDGRLYFGYHGDLWSGTIDLHEETKEQLARQNSQDFDRPTLVAARLAPLASPETYEGTPSGLGVSAIAPRADRIYTHLHRMGGSGWGSIVSIINPHVAPDANAPAPSAAKCQPLALYAKLLASIQPVANNGGAAYLCASPDGKKVFYMNDNGAFFIEETGKPARQIPIRLPE